MSSCSLPVNHTGQMLSTHLPPEMNADHSRCWMVQMLDGADVTHTDVPVRLCKHFKIKASLEHQVLESSGFLCQPSLGLDADHQRPTLTETFGILEL